MNERTLTNVPNFWLQNEQKLFKAKKSIIKQIKWTIYKFLSV